MSGGNETWSADDVEGAEEALASATWAEDASRFEPGDRLGKGAMGHVDQAFDRWLGRDVAVKFLDRRDSRSEARFLREARITARLDHPAIVPIYDAGRTDEGTPYYTMKRLAGDSLKALIKLQSLEERLTLIPHLIAACQAMAYAHDRGFVHRDLKPANIMVGTFGETWVVDWGLATAIGEELPTSNEPLAPDALRTQSGRVAGTLAYMAPEQAKGHPPGAAADIWALGAVLYTLCSQHAPRKGASVQSLLDAARVGEVTALSDGPPELISIANKAMAPKQSDRYGSALELAKDLERFQRGGLVSVHTYSTAQRLERWAAGRSRQLAAGGALLAVALVGLGVVTVRVTAAEASAQQRLRTALQVQATDLFNEGRTVEAAAVAAESLTLGEDPEARGLVMAAIGPWGLTQVASVDLPNEACRALEGHGTAAACLSWTGLTQIQGTSITVAPLKDRTCGLAPWQGGWLTRNGSQLVHVRGTDVQTVSDVTVASWDRTCDIVTSGDAWAILNAPEVQLSNGLRVSAGTNTLAIAFSPDGDELLVAQADGQLVIYDTATGEERRRKAGLAALRKDARWTQDGIYVDSGPGGVARIDPATLEQRSVGASAPPMELLSFGRPGLPVYAASFENGEVWLYGMEARRGRQLPADPTDQIKAVVLDDSTVLSVNRAGKARWWRVQDAGSWTSYEPGISELRVSGSTLAVGSTKGNVRVVDPDGRVLLEQSFGPSVVKQLAWTDDGQRLAIAVQYGTVQVFDFKTRQTTDVGVLGRSVFWDGDTLYLGDGGVKEPRGHWRPDTGFVMDEAASQAREWAKTPDGQLHWLDRKVRVWHQAAGQQPVSEDLGDVRSIAAHPTRNLLAYGTDPGVLTLVEDGQTRTIGEHPLPIDQIVFSPDGRYVATGSWDTTVKVWSVASGALVAVLQGHQRRITTLAWTDDDVITAAGWDGRALRWNGALLDVDPQVLREQITAQTGARVDASGLLTLMSVE